MITTRKAKPSWNRSHLQPQADAAAWAHPPAGQVLAAFQAARAEAEAHQTRMAARFDRIQAANEAVDACLRASGTRDYQAAFLHVQATRPELFADMHDPSGSVAAANFNPYHDPMGKFTTRDGTVAPHGRQHHQHGERPAQRPGKGAAGHTKAQGKKYDGKLTSGAYKQKIGTGHCLPAVMREAIAEISKLQTDAVCAKLKAQGAEVYPDGSLQVGVGVLEQDIRKANPQYTYDFTSTGPGSGADAEEGLSTLRASGVNSQRIAIDQISDHLNNGPVLVSAYDSGKTHAELIIGIQDDGNYIVYNPLIPGGVGTLDPKNIVTQGYPRVYALDTD